MGTPQQLGWGGAPEDVSWRVTHLALASGQATWASAAASRPLASALTRVSTIDCRSASHPWSLPS